MTAGLYRLEADLTRDQLIDELAAMPGRVRELLAGSSVEDLKRRARADEWSAIDVCKHVRDAAEVYGMRFKWMILSDDPLLANYDEDLWVERSPDGARDIDLMLDEMAAYRSETVRLLSALPSEGWSRTGRHEALGAVVLEGYVGIRSSTSVSM